MSYPIAFWLGIGGLTAAIAAAILAALLFGARRLQQQSPGGAIDPGEEVWRKTATLLPQRWGTLSAVPAHLQGKLEPIDAPYAQALVHGLAAAAPAVGIALRAGHVFRMVGPPSALDGLAGGNLAFQVDRQGLQLMNIVDKTGTIRHQPRVVEVGAQAAATAACVFQVMSVVTAQYYLHQITSHLHAIDARVAEVLGKLDDRRVGKLIAASATVNEVDGSTMASLRRGTLPQHLTASQEIWSRLAAAEADLRAVIAECEAEYGRKRSDWQAALGTLDKVEGRWVRTSVHIRAETPILNEIAHTTSRLVTLHLAATGAMFRWYQVVLTFDAITDSERVSRRYQALDAFVRDRRLFLDGIVGDGPYFLGGTDGHLFDAAKGFLAEAAALLIVPVLIADATVESGKAARASLVDVLAGVEAASRPIAGFGDAVARGDREFFLQNLGTDERPELLLLATQSA